MFYEIKQETALNVITVEMHRADWEYLLKGSRLRCRLYFLAGLVLGAITGGLFL